MAERRESTPDIEGTECTKEYNQRNRALKVEIEVRSIHSYTTTVASEKM